MSFTFKILLDKRRALKEDKFPVIIRLFANGESKEISLKIKIHAKEWNEHTGTVLPSNTNAEFYNGMIRSKKTKLENLILRASLENRGILFSEIKSEISEEKPLKQHISVAAAITVNQSIVAYANKLIKSLLDTGKVGNSIVYSCATKKLIQFAGKADISFAEITVKYLGDFQNSMIAEGIMTNTVSVYFRAIRALFNKAIREELIQPTCYPFGSFRIKSERTKNRSLTKAELQKIMALDLTVGSAIWSWRSYFLLSFCFIGMNFADLLTLTCDSIENDRIIFRRKKTHKYYSIKIQSPAYNILSKLGPLLKSNKDLLLPVLKTVNDPVQLKKDINQARKTCNEYLERMALMSRIDKNITTYYSRYTWANIARTLGISKDVIAEALGHEYGNRTTGIYLDSYSEDIIDKANFQVLDAVFS
jgi:integrase/recombinase XerD